MKTLLTFFVILIFGLILSIFGFWILDFDAGVKDNASLQISSLGGNMEVYIDGKASGVIKDTQSKIDIYNLKPGLHKVRLNRINVGVGYFSYETDINLVNSLSASINYELGPTIESSQGWVLDYTPSVETASKLIIYFDKDAQVEVKRNDQVINYENSKESVYTYPLELDSEYIIIIQKDGYIKQEINISTKLSNKLGKNDIILRTKLFEIPINLK